MGNPWERDWSAVDPNPSGIGAGTAPKLDAVIPGYERAFAAGQARVTTKPWEREWTPAPAAPPATPPGILDRLELNITPEAATRALAMGAGGVVKGILGDVPGLFLNPINTALNETGIAERLYGHRIGTNFGETVREATGAPMPSTPTERIVDAAVSGGAGGLAGAGLAGGLARFATSGPGVARTALNAFAATPGYDTIGGVGSGLAAQGAQEAGAPAWVQLAAGVAGGLGGYAGAAGLRNALRARGVNFDHVSDADLIDGALDGSIGDTGLTPDDVQAILRDGGADFDQFSSPELAASMARRMQAAQATPAPNLAAGIPAGAKPKQVGTLLDQMRAQMEQPGYQPPARTMPDDVPIIAATEGNIRADDAGGIAGVERKRAADAGVLTEAQRRVSDDPVVAEVLGSSLSPQAKVATIWERLERQRQAEPNEGMPDMPDVPDRPTVRPWQEPTPDAAARAPSSSGAQGFMDRVRARESGGNDNAKASTSSATGRYQFTDATWLATYKARFGQDGTDAQILARRGNGQLQDTLMRDLTDGNAKALRSAGFDDSEGNLYLAHFLGRQGALRALRAPADTPIINLVGGKVVGANRSILEGKTAGDVIGWTHQRMGSTPRAPDAPWRMAAPEASTIDGPYSGRSQPNRGETTMGDFENPGARVSPTNEQRLAGFDQEAPTQTGRSDRLFRDVADDPADQPGFWEDRARTMGDEAFATQQADLEAEWQARAEQAAERERNRGAGERMERERVRGEEQTAGDPSALYRGKYDQRPSKAGDSWAMTPEGFVAGKAGKPVAFRNPREAAAWAAKEKLGGDFELGAWAANTKRVVLRRRDGSAYGQPREAAPGPMEPAAGRSPDAGTRMIAGPRPIEAEPIASVRDAETGFAWVQPKRTTGNIKQTRDNVRTFMGIPIRNEATGVEAVVSSSSLGKMTSQKALAQSSSIPDHLLAVANADDLFRVAKLVERGLDKKGEPTLIISRWRANLQTPSGVRGVKLTVKETVHPDTPNKLYTLETMEVEPDLGAPQSGIERGPGQNRFPREAGSGSDIGAPPVASNQPSSSAIPSETRPPIAGGPEQVVTARGRPVDTEFEVREARDLVTSADPSFDQRFQPRDRGGRSSSDAQVAEIAARLDPEQLHTSRQAAQGAPIIGPDRMVESGNGRVSAIRRMYEMHPERAADYRAMIGRRGLDATGFDQPVLVRRRTTEMDEADRAAFVREANERDTMAMSSTEQARADAGAMSDATLGLHRGDGIAHASNRDFVRAWMDEVATPAERNTLLMKDGSLSAEGIRRVRISLLSKAFDDPTLVAKIAEDPDSGIRTIGDMLADASPALAKLRAKIAAGDLDAAYDITPKLAEMAKLIAKARDEGKKVADLVKQDDMFGGRTDPMTEALTRLMFKGDDMARPRSAPQIRAALRYYTDEAAKVQAGPGLFGDAAPPATPLDIATAANARLDPTATGFMRALMGDEQGSLDIGPFVDLLDGIADSRLGRDVRGMVGAVRNVFGDPKAAAGAVHDRIGAIGSSTLWSADSALRSMAVRFEAPTIGKIADLFHAPAGKGNGVGRTYHEAVERGVRTRTQQAFDALEPHIKDDAAMRRIRDLLATPNRSVRATASEREAAGKIRDLLKETLAYRRAAGDDIGEVTDGYFPRVLDPAAVLKNQEGFRAKAARLYRGTGMDAAAANDAAGAWMLRVLDNHAGLEGGLDHAAAGTKPNSAKSREFGKQADAMLADFYHQDVFQTLAGYLSGSVRRAEEARRFGPAGAVGSPERAAWEKAHGSKGQWEVMVDQAKAELRASGKDAAGVPERLLKIRHTNLGRLSPRSAQVSRAVSMAHAWNQLRVMDRATVSSLGDLAMGFVRGGPKYGVEHLLTSLNEFGRSIAPKAMRIGRSEARRYAEAIGTANEAFGSSLLQSRISADMPGSAAAGTVDRFYRGIGLQQLTEAGRVAATKTGQHFLRDLAHDLTSSTPRTRARAAHYLAELGVKDADAFGRQLRDGGAPGRGEVLADKAGFTAEYATALMRYVNQSILMPTKAQKPTWASHPVGGLFFALQSYSYGFKKNVLDRAARGAVDAVKERDPKMLAPASGLLVLAGLTYVNDTYVRPGLFGSNYDFDGETGGDAALRVADRMGAFGPAGAVLNAVKGFKYRRSLTDSLSGSIIGPIAQGVRSTANLAIDNDPDTNTAERAAAGDLYDLIIEPALDFGATRYLAGPLRTGAIEATGNRAGNGLMPGDREGFVSGMAGENDE